MPKPTRPTTPQRPWHRNRYQDQAVAGPLGRNNTKLSRRQDQLRNRPLGRHQRRRKHHGRHQTQAEKMDFNRHLRSRLLTIQPIGLILTRAELRQHPVAPRPLPPVTQTACCAGKEPGDRQTRHPYSRHRSNQAWPDKRFTPLTTT